VASKKVVTPHRAVFVENGYLREQALAMLAEVEKDPRAAQRSRVGVLLANRNFDQTRTITHVTWTTFGVLPVGAVQLPTATSPWPWTSSSTGNRAATR
jgi:hypothetical protein